METKERLARLERSARRWRAAGVTAFVLLAVGVAAVAARQQTPAQASSASPSPAMEVVAHQLDAGTIRANVVRANIFEVVGEDRKTYAAFAGGKEVGATLSLGQVGQGQIILNAHADHRIEIYLVASGSAERMKLALDAEGLPQLTLSGLPGTAMLSEGPRGDGFLMLHDHEGHSRLLTAEK